MDITQDNGLLLVIIIEPIIRKEELFEVFFSLSLSLSVFVYLNSFSFAYSNRQNRRFRNENLSSIIEKQQVTFSRNDVMIDT